MRILAVLILLAIALSIIIPPTFPFMNADRWRAEIGTLDVCHSAQPALSGNGDMPCKNEYACALLPLEQSAIGEIFNTPFKLTLFVFQEEHPPKA
ncbi:MAG TPA: hypothetical protein VLX29_03775 [Nitrospirota bacterium]|jgi:type II secretory pathway pseudopilin PulG|nr:hypothetical protein [Nitrospirota bacterium]